MIERFYLKNHLSFKEVELEFDKNLIIFSGPSGAGKSILMDALLSLFGLKDTHASQIEASIYGDLGLESFGIDEDEPNIFRLNKEKSVRYFINNQQISKKNIKQASSSFINYLTLREFKEFENSNLLNLLDKIATKNAQKHQPLLSSFYTIYQSYKSVEKKLHQIIKDEKKIIELKEFVAYEIQKIESISPKVGEYEELIIQKKELSKKEKLEESIITASTIFEYETKVSEALTLLEENSIFFDETINELKVIFENATERLNDLKELNIEEMLDRLEILSSLKNRHGSIEEALSYLEKKREELDHFENLAFEKEKLENELLQLNLQLEEKTTQITKNRKKALMTLKERVEEYLNLLYLNDINFTIKEIAMNEWGADEIHVSLKTTDLTKVSSGELNRVRLAFLAASSEFIQESRGILILDEIDANLSGKESMSIAGVLQKLSLHYQIFAISHQPQLSSKADMHFLVYKEGEKSQVKLLKKDERIKELSRMISGEEVSSEAITFAKSLLNS